MKKALPLLLLCPVLALAQPWWLKGSQAKDADFLPPDEAFRVSASVDGNLIKVGWSIADGYYLYRSKFDITPESPGLSLDPPVFPNGTTKTDEYFGTQEIYRQGVQSMVGYRRSDGGAHPLQIKITYQGCADAGLCYPPLVKVVTPEIPTAATALQVGVPPAAARAPAPADGRVSAILALAGAMTFFAAGLALRRRRIPARP